MNEPLIDTAKFKRVQDHTCAAARSDPGRARIDRGCHTLNSLRYPVRIGGEAELNGQPLSFEQLPSPTGEPALHPRALIGTAKEV